MGNLLATCSVSKFIEQDISRNIVGWHDYLINKCLIFSPVEKVNLPHGVNSDFCIRFSLLNYCYWITVIELLYNWIFEKYFLYTRVNLPGFHMIWWSICGSSHQRSSGNLS